MVKLWGFPSKHCLVVVVVGDCALCAGPHNTHLHVVTTLSANSWESDPSTPLYFASTAKQPLTRGTPPGIRFTPAPKPPPSTKGNRG